MRMIYNQIIENAKKDSTYTPYCMRCPRLVRMVKVEDFYWTCKCGAKCDLRKEAKENI